ncbi:MAG: winged helix-turn-helix transcriptional regulator [Candidatus Hodarchaeales archaeon]|jgi:DNA-binding HxlR family transcriptional regulator
MVEMKVCPTKFAFKFFKKWSIEVVRDIWFGKERFSEILESNPGLSSKVLSQRLKELIKYGIIDKRVVSKTPMRAEYKLTEKGQALNKIMYDLAIFSYDYYTNEIFEGNPLSRSEMIKVTSDNFKIT